MKQINSNLYINENNIQGVQKIDDTYILTTTNGNNIVISESLFNDLKEYEGGGGGGTSYSAGNGIDITDGVISNTYTDVEANPELAGTEADLSSIQIGDTKYKVGGGTTLYQHNIYVNQDGVEATFKIINNSNVKFTDTTLKSYLWDNYFRANSDYPYIYEASGFRYTNSGGTPKCEIFVGVYNDTSARLVLRGRDITNPAVSNYVISSANNIYDKVTTL